LRARVFRVPTLVGSCVSVPRADRGPQAGSPLGVVDATGSVDCGLRIADCGFVTRDPVATARGSDTGATARLESVLWTPLLTMCSCRLTESTTTTSSKPLTDTRALTKVALVFAASRLTPAACNGVAMSAVTLPHACFALRSIT